MLSANDICIIITTFRPDNTILDRINDAVKMAPHVVVVDDTGPTSDTGILITNTSRVTYIHNNDNFGISKSLNIGVSAAKNLGFHWFTTLDDDTIISPSYLNRLVSFYNRTNMRNIGVLALSRFDSNTKPRPTSHSSSYRTKRTIITSGSLFNTQAFDTVGGFNEDLFIDLVDFDFCTRLRRHGYDIVQLEATGMHHQVGNMKVIGGKYLKIKIYNHHPFRLYYQTRNPILFAKEHFWFDCKLSIAILLDILRIPAKSILFEKNKIERMLYILLGLIDGIRGKTGKIGNYCILSTFLQKNRS